VEVFIDASYGAEAMPIFQERAQSQARQMLGVVVAPYLISKERYDCGRWAELVTLVVYQWALDPQGEATTQLVESANQAWATCENLTEAMGSSFRDTLADPKAHNDAIYDLVMWSITLTEAQLVPSLDLAPDAPSLLPLLWKYLANYPIPEARHKKNGANDPAAYDGAYLATHIAYIPTGYGRHPITREMAPWLYRYLRANFYSVLEMGELDLVGEFVDLFRQYGCSEHNDRQLRDGSRHLLELYAAAGQRWMSHRESYETPESNPYDLIHKPWTAVAGLRLRTPLPSQKGNYGDVVLRAIQGPPSAPGDPAPANVVP